MRIIVHKIGNGLGVVLPLDVIERLKVRDGDSLYLAEEKDGYRLSTFDPEIAGQIASGKKIMRRYVNTLRRLAND